MSKKTLLLMLLMALLVPLAANAQSYCQPAFSYTGTNYGLYIKSFLTDGGINNISNTTSLTSGGYTDYYDSYSASIEAGGMLNITVTPGGTANSMGYALWVDWNQDYEFTTDEQVAVTSVIIKAIWETSFIVPSTTAEGDYRMRVMLLYGNNPSNPCVSAAYGEAEDYKLTVFAAPDCIKPNNLNVATITNESAIATWLPGDGNKWNLRYKNVHNNGWISVNGLTVATYTMENLDAATSYEVQVQTDCDNNGTSEWANTFFTTTCSSEDMCELSYELTTKSGYESYGWYGSYIKVMDANTNEILTTWTVPQNVGGTNSGTFAVCDGRELKFEWHSNNANNDKLLIGSILISDVNGDPIISQTGALTSAIPYTMDCTVASCFIPTGLYVTGVDKREATLNWTENGSATKWVVAYKSSTDLDFTEKIVDANPYTLTELAPKTEYTVKVRPVCEEEKWSNTETFTTLVACPAPTGLHAENITPFTADLTWTSDAGNYQVRYGEHTAASESLIYDNGTYTTSIGNGSQFYWAVMHPAGSYSGNYLSKVTVYDPKAMTGSIMIYNDGTTAPDNLVATMNIAFTGAETFVEFTFDQLVEINPTQNLWIVFYNESATDYPAAAYSEPDNANARWISFNGTTWQDVGPLVSSGYYGWMIRANIETISISGTVNDYTGNTYPLTGLTPETTYAAQVRTVCGGIDGESDWVTTLFTTEAGRDFIIDGNWNDGSNWLFGVVPDDGSSVTIQANAIIPAGYDAIADIITLDGGSITIKDGGQLHCNNNVQATVEKDITGYSGADGHYYFIAHPLNSYVNPANSGIASGSKYDLYSFNGTLEGEEWRNYEAEGGTFNMTSGIGYLYANIDDITLHFTGTVRKQYTNLLYNGTALNYNTTTIFGTWNLVGNMLPHNAYVYLGTIGSSGVVFADEMYYYQMNDDGDEIVSTDGNEMVKPCEGIFVQSSAADQYAFFSSVKHTVKSKGLNMSLTANGKLVDRATLSFEECNGLEKFQLNPNHTKVYVPVDGKYYAVTHAEEQGEMPVNFKAEKNGTYTLSFNTEDLEFCYLHLIDHLTGNDVDLLATPSYTFDAQYTDYASRFKLVFAKADNGNSEQFAFINNGEIILSGVNGNSTVQLFDVTGRMLSSTNGANRISTENMAAGVYVLRLINGSDVKTQKIIVR